MAAGPLTSEEFEFIYSKANRLTVEALLIKDGKVLLTKRAIQPYLKFWHIPGGTVHYGEKLEDAVKRIARREIGIDVNSLKQVGVVEYPEILKDGNGSCTGIAFEITGYEGGLEVNEEAESLDWFKELPENTLQDHVNYLKADDYID